MDILEVVQKVIEITHIESEFADELKNLRVIVETLFSYLKRLDNYDGVDITLLS